MNHIKIDVHNINQCFEKYKRGKTKAQIRAEEKSKRIKQMLAAREGRIKQSAQRIKDKNSFANRMYALRKYKGLTQKQVAIGMNIAVSMISMWETGRHYPSEKYRIAIVDFLTKRNIPEYLNPYEPSTPFDKVRVLYKELSPRSPLGFRYVSDTATELPEAYNENVADMGETVGVGKFTWLC